MKKLSLFLVGAVSLALTSCGALGSTGSSLNAGSVLSSLASSATSGSTLTNILSSVIGTDNATQSDIIGTWNYNQPGCAFTSESALAKAGGEVVASEVKTKLASQYKTLGFKSSNTSFTFNEDNTFSAKILGKSVSGTYTFDSSTQAITMNLSVLGVSAYTLGGFVKRNSDGIALLFESKKILSILQTLGAVSGNSTVSTISQISSNYSAVRIGFDLTK